MVQENEVIPLLHCTAVNVVKDGDTITGVITESKSGRNAIMAKRIIDATGDADVAFHAGAPFRKDPKEKLMGVTVNFGCAGIDMNEFYPYYMKHISERPGVLAFYRTSKEAFYMGCAFHQCLSKPTENPDVCKLNPENINMKKFWKSYEEAGQIYSFNGIHMRGIDCTDVWDLTKAEIEGRERVIRAIKNMKKNTPGFQKARLKNIGSSLGTRESRRIIGEYNLTEHDIKNQARFEDSIGICPEFIDGFGTVILPTTGRYFQVPYRLIVPLKVENLLVVGRSVGGDKISHAATRQMVCCTITGQGAGIAAAVSIKDNVPCRQVDISKVQKALKKQDIRIE
jgi:hypothetical protein